MKKTVLFLLIVLMSGCARRGAYQPPSLELDQKQQRIAQNDGLLDGTWLLKREAEGFTKLVIDTQRQQVIVTEKTAAVRSGLDAEIVFISNLEKIENSYEDVLKKGQVGNEIAEIYVEITKTETVSQQATEELAYHYLDTITGNLLTAKESKQLVRRSNKGASWLIDDPQLLTCVTKVNNQKKKFYSQTYTIYPDDNHVLEEQVFNHGKLAESHQFTRVLSAE